MQKHQKKKNYGQNGDKKKRTQMNSCKFKESLKIKDHGVGKQQFESNELKFETQTITNT